jgi:hypothetical protein
MSFQTYNAVNQIRITLRDANFNHNGPSNEQRVRTAQIKTIQKFIGRLRTDNKNYEAILTEMEGLNLSKYLEEISSLMAVCVNEREIRFYTDVAIGGSRWRHGSTRSMRAYRLCSSKI